MTAASSEPPGSALRRRGYILIVVLGFAAIVTSLGWAFLQSNSTVMPEAVNRYGAVRAQYLAESGVDIATHFLMYPPSTVSSCAYWTGANGIAIDSSTDYVNVSVAQDAGTTSTFTINSVGVARNPDGTVRGKRTITAKVVRPAEQKLKIPYALLGNAGAMSSSIFEIPYGVQADGDLHAEGGTIWSSGWCNGRVTATDWICWSLCGGTGPPSAVNSYAASFGFPPISPTNYSAYIVQGNSYTAAVYTSSTMSAAQASTLNSSLNGTMATNPGRVVYRNGGLELGSGVVLNATLAVKDKLTIDSPTAQAAQVTAVQDYPAVVVGGDMEFKNDSRSATFVGPVLVNGQIKDNTKNYTALYVTGTCLVKKGFRLDKWTGTYRFTYDCNRSVFWDLASAVTTQPPMTILSWKEN